MRGFTLMEAMIALLLMSFTGVALGQCLLAAQRAQRESGAWMRAIALSEEALERARARDASGADLVEGYQRSWSSVAAGDGLRRIEAAVTWSGHEYRLASLVKDGP